jgi:tetratricopeptide (TPR) repeat protein
MRLLDEDVNPQEAEELQQITAQWGKRPNQTLPHSAKPYRRWTLVFAGAAASLLAGVLVFNFALDWTADPDSATEVVQLLLAQSRPFEARLSDQPHLPIVRTRGVESGVAYGLLAREMTRLSANTHEMGRFYLLQKDFERAINYLAMAEQEAGTPAAVHNDLGVAFLESGVEEGVRKAGGEFRHALELDESYAPAVFNLALLNERTGAIAQAETHWRRFLELETGTPWAAEARARLAGIASRGGAKGGN